MRTTATILGNLRLTTNQLVLSTLLLLGLMLAAAGALRSVNVTANAAPALSGADDAARRKEQGLDLALVAAVKRAHSRAAVTAGCGFVEQQKLNSSDGVVADLFGFAVALDGDTAVVGVPFDQVSAARKQGSAYVFVRSGATWQQQAQLFASDGVGGDRFGQTVAISGNYIAIGASQKVVFGANLTTSTQAAPTGMLPTQLAGASVRVKDSLGAERLAPLFFPDRLRSTTGCRPARPTARPPSP